MPKRKPRKDSYFSRPHLLNFQETKYRDTNSDESTETEMNLFETQRNIVSNIKKNISSLPYTQRAREVRKHIKFIRSFCSLGVQGIAGLLEISGNPVVFKVSCDINRSVEHEHLILENMNDMRKYNPHFVRTLGMLELPVSSEFMMYPQEYSLFDDSDETLPRNILLLEFSNKLPFYRLCQDTDDKNIIMSEILQVLLALEIAQTKKRFTHYDLHTSNVLVQMCDVNSVFLYKIKEKMYVVPTYGFYPLIIDTGISYAKCVEGHQMMSNTDNYDHGFQTTVYDTLNDVHHFLVTTLYYIETDAEKYDFLSNKIKIMFEHLPVLRKSGWKRLPNDLCDVVLDRIREDCSDSWKYDLFQEYKKESLEVLNGLIKLPMIHRGNSNFDCFSVVLKEYSKMIDIDDFTDGDILFILRTIVDCVNEHRNDYVDSSNQTEVVEKFRNTFISRVSDVIPMNVVYNNSKETVNGIDYEKLLLGCIVFSERLETCYRELIDDNNKEIERVYEKTKIKTPIDIFSYNSKNLTPHFEIDNETVIYYWDIDSETSDIKTCRDLTREQLKSINSSRYSDKSYNIHNIFFVSKT